jgi:hypothetical protein
MRTFCFRQRLTASPRVSSPGMSESTVTTFKGGAATAESTTGSTAEGPVRVSPPQDTRAMAIGTTASQEALGNVHCTRRNMTHLHAPARRE